MLWWERVKRAFVVLALRLQIQNEKRRGVFTCIFERQKPRAAVLTRGIAVVCVRSLTGSLLMETRASLIGFGACRSVINRHDDIKFQRIEFSKRLRRFKDVFELQSVWCILIDTRVSGLVSLN